jgi:hypothetical protein
LKDKAGEAYDTLAPKVAGGAEFIKDKAVDGAGFVKDSAVNGAEFVKDKAGEAYDTLAPKVADGAEFIKDKAGEAYDTLAPKVAGGAEFIKDKAGEAFDAIKPTVEEAYKAGSEKRNPSLFSNISIFQVNSPVNMLKLVSKIIYFFNSQFSICIAKDKLGKVAEDVKASGKTKL